jgi:hypothetical protein
MTYQEWKTNELAGEGGFTFAEEELTLSAYKAGLEHNEQNVCDECDPENYGWVFNRVEGRGACTCMLEAEPFQILLKALGKIANSTALTVLESPFQQIAKEALRAVLPLDYAE